MDRIVASALILLASAAAAFAGTPTPALPEPATMTLFGLSVGGAYLAKRFIGRK